MIEGIDYCFICPKDDDTIAHIKLLDGPYKNTIFKYGKVSFKISDNGVAHLLFAYYVLESPVMSPKKMEKDSKFKQYAGDMLVSFMTANLDEDIIDETRNNDIEEPDLLGRLSQKSSSIFEE